MDLFKNNFRNINVNFKGRLRITYQNLEFLITRNEIFEFLN